MKLSNERDQIIYNHIVKDLSICDYFPSEEALSLQGFVLETYYAFENMDGDIVDIETYSNQTDKIVLSITSKLTESEGTLEFKTVYATPDYCEIVHKELLDKSVQKPALSLIKTILFWQDISTTAISDIMDYSNYRGCSHYKLVKNDRILQKTVLENFVKIFNEQSAIKEFSLEVKILAEFVEAYLKRD